MLSLPFLPIPMLLEETCHNVDGPQPVSQEKSITLRTVTAYLQLFYILKRSIISIKPSNSIKNGTYLVNKYSKFSFIYFLHELLSRIIFVHMRIYSSVFAPFDIPLNIYSIQNSVTVVVEVNCWKQTVQTFGLLRILYSYR